MEPSLKAILITTVPMGTVFKSAFNFLNKKSATPFLTMVVGTVVISRAF